MRFWSLEREIEIRNGIVSLMTKAGFDCGGGEELGIGGSLGR